MNRSTDNPQVHIGHLRLRVPGTSRETGQSLARHLQERLADLPTAGVAVHLGAIGLRVPATPGMTAESMADAVADALGRKLQRHRGSTADSTHA